MGWTGIFNAIRKANGTIDRKATLEREFSGWTSGDKITRMIKSGMSGSTFYAAMETTTEAGREVWALVVLTSLNGGEFCYKEMDETEGPYYYECPKGILDALTPTTNATANEWRQKCREAREKKKAAAGRIPRNAARLYITFLVSTSASKAGESVTVEKIRDQWIYVDKTGNRWRLCAAHLRNEDFIRIDKAETAEEAARTDAEEAARKAQEQPEPIKAEETTPAPTEGQEAPENGPTSPEKGEGKETTTETAEAPTKAKKRLCAWRVQCREIGGDWQTYSEDQPTREDAERIREEAAARQELSINGTPILYRIVYVDKGPAPEDAPEIVPGARLYCHPVKSYVIVDGIEEETTPGALVRVLYKGRLYLVSCNDLYADETERTPATLPAAPTTDGTTAADTDTTSTPEEATQTEITTEGSTEEQTQITTPGKAADTQTTTGRRKDQPGTAGHNQTTERRTTSRTTTRGSPTRPQTAPQRAATSRAAPTTTARAKSPPRAKNKVLRAIAHEPRTNVPDPGNFLEKHHDNHPEKNIRSVVPKNSPKNQIFAQEISGLKIEKHPPGFKIRCISWRNFEPQNERRTQWQRSSVLYIWLLNTASKSEPKPSNHFRQGFLKNRLKT